MSPRLIGREERSNRTDQDDVKCLQHSKNHHGHLVMSQFSNWLSVITRLLDYDRLLSNENYEEVIFRNTMRLLP